VYVRWRPFLSTHSRKRFWKFFITHCSMVEEIAATSSWRTRSMFWRVLSEGCLVGCFLFVGFSEASHPQQYSVVTRDTVVLMNTEVLTKYLLSHDDRIVVFEIRDTSPQRKPSALQTSAACNWNVLSLARRTLTGKFPVPTVPYTAVFPNRQVFLLDPVDDPYGWSINITPLTLNSCSI
jgi:hypothetical protein